MSAAEHAELERLRQQLAEAEDALSAIRSGEIDAIVVQCSTGPVVYTLKTADTPYRLLVEQMREGALTVSAEGIIIYANAAFARMVDVPAARLRGADFMEFIADASDRRPARLFTGPGGSGRDFRLRTARGEVRNVYMSSAPLTIDDKQVHCVIAIDLTRQELRRRHEAIVNSSADAIYSLTLDGTITTWNQAAKRLYGYTPEEVIGRKVDMLFPAQGLGSEVSSARLMAAGQSQQETMQVAKCGKRIEVAISVATFDDAGVPEGISIIARDISERNRAQEHIKHLLRESSHRSKNLLAVIQAIAAQTARAAGSVDQFQDRFGQRLRSMALSHDLLVSEDWKRARLADLVCVQLQPFVEPGSRLQLVGPDVYVTPDAAQHIGLALHELATNAAKYGAWSTAAGQVTVSWQTDESPPDAGLHLSWRERNGPRVAPPSHKGFGTTLTQDVIADALETKVAAEFAPEGLTWTIEIPSRYVPAVRRRA
jgi:PAS domain S-box-containing protein